MSEKKIQASGHFLNVLDGGKQRRIIDECLQKLSGLDFDTFVFMGLSGATVAPILAYKMEKEMLMVRKNGGDDNSNSGRWIEGNFSARRVVVVDDLINTGKTMSQVMHAIRYLQDKETPEIKIVGLLLHCVTHLRDFSVQYHPKLYRRGEHAFDWMIRCENEHPHPTPFKADVANKPPLYEEEEKS